MDIPEQSGWIEVICGSMFSGKSEELIRRVRRGLYAKQEIMVFKPKLDDRYSLAEVVSHNGTAIAAQPVEWSSEIIDAVHPDVDIIAIDEAQFFDEGLIQVAQVLADAGHRVIIAGLDQDFRGQPFGSMPKLMAVAEHVTKLHAVCAICGSRASRTQRLLNGEPAYYEDPVIMIGADEAYEARCRHHHEVPKREHSTVQDK